MKRMYVAGRVIEHATGIIDVCVGVVELDPDMLVVLVHVVVPVLPLR